MLGVKVTILRYSPGDVMADGDGVIVVPREHAEDVAKAAMQYLDNIGLERYKKMQQSAKQ